MAVISTSSLVSPGTTATLLVGGERMTVDVLRVTHVHDRGQTPRHWHVDGALITPAIWNLIRLPDGTEREVPNFVLGFGRARRESSVHPTESRSSSGASSHRSA